MAKVIKSSGIMASVTYGKCNLWQLCVIISKLLNNK